MFKKLILPMAMICFLLSLMCSCNKTGAESEGTTALKTVKDSNGKTYSAIVNGDGFLILGEKQQLAITVDDGKGKPGKNADGEFVTREVPFPSVVFADDEIHTEFLRMKVPDKWKNESDYLLKLTYKEGDSTATYVVNSRSSFTVKECQDEIDEIMSVMFDQKEEETVKLDFADALKIKYENENYENQIVFYIFNVEDRTFFVKITADEKLLEEIDFLEIINTMKFRKGE